MEEEVCKFRETAIVELTYRHIVLVVRSYTTSTPLQPVDHKSRPSASSFTFTVVRRGIQRLLFEMGAVRGAGVKGASFLELGTFFLHKNSNRKRAQIL